MFLFIPQNLWYVFPETNFIVNDCRNYIFSNFTTPMWKVNVINFVSKCSLTFYWGNLAVTWTCSKIFYNIFISNTFDRIYRNCWHRAHRMTGRYSLPIVVKRTFKLDYSVLIILWNSIDFIGVFRKFINFILFIYLNLIYSWPKQSHW